MSSKKNKGINITSNIKLENNYKINNTYTEIEYNNFRYKLNSRNPLTQNKITYKCIYQRQIKNKDENQTLFCDGTIVALKDETDNTKYNFFLKAEHSDSCIRQFRELNKSSNDESKPNLNNKGNINNNNKDINKKNLNQYSSYSHINSEKKENEYPIGKNNINDEDYKIFNEFNDKIYSLNQFDNIIKNYYFKKNNTRIRQCEYVKLGTKLYEKAGCKKYFKLPETHIKNLYAKHRNELNPYNMSDIFEYSKEIANLGDFCRGYEEKIIFKDNKEKFLHRHMIFYSNFDFKRLYVSKNISIDGTYIFPKGFNQTIIIILLAKNRN